MENPERSLIPDDDAINARVARMQASMALKDEAKKQKDLEKASFPSVIKDNGNRVSLRFKRPIFNLDIATVTMYECETGISYLDTFEHVLGCDLDDCNFDPAVLEADIILSRKEDRARSTAHGMLLLLYRFISTKSRAQACAPPLSHSLMVSWRNRYPNFDETMADIEGSLCDIAEEELYERAVNGTDHFMVVDKELVTVTKKSDELLKFYLTHNRPKRYNVGGGKGGSTVNVNTQNNNTIGADGTVVSGIQFAVTFEDGNGDGFPDTAVEALAQDKSQDNIIDIQQDGQ